MILVKFFDSTGQTITQQFVEDVVNTDDDLFGPGIANFSVTIDSSITEKQKISILEVDEVGQDTVVFNGYIKTINPVRKSFSKINITAWSDRGSFDDLYALSNTSISGSIGNIKTALLDQYNVYGLNYTINTDIVDSIETINVNMGDNFTSVIDSICGQFDAYWNIENNVVNIKKLLGEDKSLVTSPNYTEAYFNGFFPSESNISEIKGGSIGSIYNVLIVKSGASTQIFDNYNGTFLGAKLQELRDGVIVDKAQKILDQGGQQKRNYSISIEANTINANVGDKVKVVVQNTNQYYDINASCFVTKKSIQYSKGKIVNYEFQEFPTLQLTTQEFNRQVSKQLQYNIIK